MATQDGEAALSVTAGLKAEGFGQLPGPLPPGFAGLDDPNVVKALKAQTDDLWAQHLEKIRRERGEARPRRSRRRRSRQFHLDQAVQAVRHYLGIDPAHEPTEQDICDFIAAEEGIACPRSTLTTRWRRLEDYGEEIITIDEVRRIAHQ